MLKQYYKLINMSIYHEQDQNSTKLPFEINLFQDQLKTELYHLLNVCEEEILVSYK